MLAPASREPQMLEEEPWKNTVSAELGIKGKAQFLIRVGYVKSIPEAVSLRMPLERIVKF